MFKRTVPLLLLAALVLPTAAQAENSELTGPVLVKGKGPVRAEVTMEGAAGRPLVLGGKGVVRLIDLGGDLRVSGACREMSAERDGKTVEGFVCRAAAGRIRAHGSHFRVAGLLRVWGMAIPQGASVKLRGRYRIHEPGAGSDREKPEREKPERGKAERGKAERDRPANDRPANDRPADDGPADDGPADDEDE